MCGHGRHAGDYRRGDVVLGCVLGHVVLLDMHMVVVVVDVG